MRCRELILIAEAFSKSTFSRYAFRELLSFNCMLDTFCYLEVPRSMPIAYEGSVFLIGINCKNVVSRIVSRSLFGHLASEFCMIGSTGMIIYRIVVGGIWTSNILFNRHSSIETTHHPLWIYA